MIPSSGIGKYAVIGMVTWAFSRSAYGIGTALFETDVISKRLPQSEMIDKIKRVYNSFAHSDKGSWRLAKGFVECIYDGLPLAVMTWEFFNLETRSSIVNVTLQVQGVVTVALFSGVFNMTTFTNRPEWMRSSAMKDCDQYERYQNQIFQIAQDAEAQEEQNQYPFVYNSCFQTRRRSR